MATQELQTVNMSNYRALKTEDQDEIRAVVAENLGQSNFRPEIIKTPSGEALFYQVEGENGLEAVREIEGVILFQSMKRALFEGEYDGQTNRQPVCRSSDMLYGEGNPGGECRMCPHSKFGGRCTPKMELLMLREQDVFPVLVRVPPSALGAMQDYLSFLTRRGLRRSAVVTRLGLVSATATKGKHAGKKYARMHPELAGKLSPQDRERIALYLESIKALVDKMTSAGLYEEVEEGTPVHARPGYRAEDERQDSPPDADGRMPEMEPSPAHGSGMISLQEWTALKNELLAAGVKIDDFGAFLKEHYQIVKSSQIPRRIVPELREALSQGYIGEWIRQELVRGESLETEEA